MTASPTPAKGRGGGSGDRGPQHQVLPQDLSASVKQPLRPRHRQGRRLTRSNTIKNADTHSRFLLKHLLKSEGVSAFHVPTLSKMLTLTAEGAFRSPAQPALQLLFRYLLQVRKRTYARQIC